MDKDTYKEYLEAGVTPGHLENIETREGMMSKVWQEKLVGEFNRSFNEPFMPEGFCEAKISKDSRGERILRIRLGDRDVAFDWLGNPIGSGSNVGSATKWEIQRRTEPLPDIIDENQDIK